MATYYELHITAKTKTEREYLQRLVIAYFLERDEFKTRQAERVEGKTIITPLYLHKPTDFAAFCVLARTIARATGAELHLN